MVATPALGVNRRVLILARSPGALVMRQSSTMRLFQLVQHLEMMSAYSEHIPVGSRRIRRSGGIGYRSEILWYLNLGFHGSNVDLLH